MSRNARRRPDSGSVRIIGGQWRGRKLAVADRPGLRPSADRQRETLFNWLQSVTPGARVLDLFAGSGALGFEALSRGAAHATLIENHRAGAEALRRDAAMLDARGCRVLMTDAIAWLKLGRPTSEPAFDLVFIDPPFDSGLLPQAVEALEQGHWLHDNALIYAEFSAHAESGTWPANWAEKRRAGSCEVACILFQHHGPGEGDPS